MDAVEPTLNLAIGANTLPTRSHEQTHETQQVAPIIANVLVAAHVKTHANTPDSGVFTYAIPQSLQSTLQVGQQVHVPFGRAQQTGFVVGIQPQTSSDEAIALKPVTRIVQAEPLFDAAYADWLSWVAQYYGTSLLTVLETALPARLVSQGRWMVTSHLSEQAEPVHPQTQQALSGDFKSIWAILVEMPYRTSTLRSIAKKAQLKVARTRTLLSKFEALGWVTLELEQAGLMQPVFQPAITSITLFLEGIKLTKRQQALFEQLQPLTLPMPLTRVQAELGTTANTLKKLAALGVLTIEDHRLYRDEHAMAAQYRQDTHADREVALNNEQQAAVEHFQQAQKGSTHVLYGVTGSGKTEVYLQRCHEALAAGQSVMILVPEISLTSHLAKRVVARFGVEQVCIWHSQLSDGERVDAWHRVRSGRVKLVIGARSAIFMPLQNLSTIIIDEAHETTLKQDQPDPRYDARLLAQERIVRVGGTLILGSATPAVTQYYEANRAGTVVKLTERFGSRPLAQVETLMTSQYPLALAGGVLREPLVEAMKEVIEQGQQVMLCLNRRGFYTLVECHTCGAPAQCPHCDVSVTVHKSYELVRCHYCGYQAPIPTHCKSCASGALQFSGLGTQRLEDELAQVLPKAKVIRLDGDAMRQKNAHLEILKAFESGEANVLVGTQMIAKGLNIPNVTLVGVVGIDGMLNLPDYLSDERVFQMLTQVAGRAGRGDLPGRVIIQTNQPTHPVIQRASQQDFDGFYSDEIDRRHIFAFPPFSQLFRVVVSSQDEAQAKAFCQSVSMNLAHDIQKGGFDLAKIRLLGPSACVVSRIRGYYRYHLLIKNLVGQAGHELILNTFKGIDVSDGVRLVLDVDALNSL